MIHVSIAENTLYFINYYINFFYKKKIFILFLFDSIKKISDYRINQCPSSDYRNVVARKLLKMYACER